MGFSLETSRSFLTPDLYYEDFDFSKFDYPLEVPGQIPRCIIITLNSAVGPNGTFPVSQGQLVSVAKIWGNGRRRLFSLFTDGYIDIRTLRSKNPNNPILSSNNTSEMTRESISSLD